MSRSDTRARKRRLAETTETSEEREARRRRLAVEVAANREDPQAWAAMLTRLTNSDHRVWEVAEVVKLSEDEVAGVAQAAARLNASSSRKGKS